ncbi:MAG: hypothetical protein ACREP7_15150 [Lysobacter sp.]
MTAFSVRLRPLCGAMALIALWSAAHPAWAQDSDCDFDQAALARRLQQAASRHGGAKLDPIEKTATWTLRNGETVQVAYGGCVDLGATVRLIYAKGRAAPARAAAIQRSIDSVARYWSDADARRLQAAYKRGGLREQEIRPGVTELSGSLDPGGFSFEFHIQQSASEVSISWQEA